MTIDEIAEIFECPKGTVMSRLNLARSKMKKVITAVICALVLVGGGIALAVILSGSDSNNNISSEAGTSKTVEKDTTQAEKDTKDDNEDTIYVEYYNMDARYTLPMMHYMVKHFVT